MSLDPPDFATGTLDQWYAYFRLKSYLPAMPHAFRETLAEAIDADCARRIMTGYVAAATDITIMFTRNRGLDEEYLHSMREMFDLNPADLLHLNAHDIATLAGIDRDFYRENLRLIGFKVSDQGQIAAYAPPAPPAPKQAPGGPKTP